MKLPKPKRAKGSRRRSSMPPRIRRRRKGGTSWAARECDRICGEIVRQRGACEVCGGRGYLQWAHIVSRRYRNVRWDWQTNALCLCRGCHYRFTLRPLEWEQEVIRQLSLEGYQDLKRRALEIRDVDVRATLESLRSEAKRLGLIAA